MRNAEKKSRFCFTGVTKRVTGGADTEGKTARQNKAFRQTQQTRDICDHPPFLAGVNKSERLLIVDGLVKPYDLNYGNTRGPM